MNKIYNNMYVGGRWWPVEKTFSDINPSDDSEWARVPDVGVVEVRNAIDSAHHAFR